MRANHLSLMAMLAATLFSGCGSGNQGFEKKMYEPIEIRSDQDLLFEWLEQISGIQEDCMAIQQETFGVRENITKFQDFDNLHRRTLSLLSKVKEMREAHDKDMANHGKQYPDFFNLSSDYLSVFENRLSQLAHIHSRLADQSKVVGAYPWSEYQKDIEKYNQLVERYHELGTKMNASYRSILEGMIPQGGRNPVQ